MLIADEPKAALDVTIEAQILNLMKDLQKEFDMSIIMITHDLGGIGEMSDRVLVIYTGKICRCATYSTKDPQNIWFSFATYTMTAFIFGKNYTWSQYKKHTQKKHAEK